MNYHLAQYNVAKVKWELTDPRMKGFIDNLHYINELADNARGFVWRLHDDTGHSSDIRPYDDKLLLITFSCWESIEAVREFTYTKQHAAMLAQRNAWFEHISDYAIALWWIPAGEVPTVEEAKERLAYLRKHGPTPHVFNFKHRFPAPHESVERTDTVV